MPEPDDCVNALATKAREGDPAALGLLLERLRSMIAAQMRKARVHLNDREDCCQEACLIILRCVPRFDPAIGSFRGYAYASVRKAIANFQRHNGRQLLAAMPDDLAYEPSEAELSAADLLVRATYPDVVKSYFGLGRPERNLNQIATELQCSPAAVKRMLIESLEAMRAGDVS